MIYFLLAIGFILIIFFSFATQGLWTKYGNIKVVKVFLLPGTIVHELSHALLCLITGTTITELNLFTPDNTGIKYDKPKVPFVFDFIIVAAPIFGCAFIIFLISELLSNPIHLNKAFFHEFNFTFKGFSDLIRHLLDAVWITINTFWNQIRIKNIRHIFFLLTIVIFTVSMSPQKHDIKHLVLGFSIISGIFFFIEKAGLHLSNHPWWNFCIKELWVITALSISVLATLLFITLITVGFITGYRLTLGQKGKSKGTGKDDSKDARNANKGARK